MVKARIVKALFSVALACAVAACISGYPTSYTPVIDVYGSPGKERASYQRDLAECQQLSAQRDQVGDAAKGALGGGAIGAAGGAIGGAFAGDAGRGAAIGSAGGALLGLLGSAYASNVNNQDIVMNCMRNRGWSVVGR